ncbi:hypothetical protein [Owenweeksia hongkongensis]|uniref:hypothetical protein n=1 Tax=Owenweeksia hongkongensis TaxID=253245 RepID=UPI003A90833A
MEAKKIEAIKKYLSFYDAKYYDVQAELIDHFASAVEKAERENPDIPFKHALIKAHRSFGGREGFRKYIDAAKKDVRKKTDKMILNLLLQLLHWPYILLTAAVVFIWHLVLQNWNTDVNLLYLVVMLTGGISVGIINYVQLKDIDLFLPKHANYYLGSFFYFSVYLPYYFLILIQDERPNHFLLVASLSLMTFIFISFARIPKLAIKETLKLYPEIA